MKYSIIEDYPFLYEFLKGNYMDFLLENNVTMIHFNVNTTTSFLIYKDEIFIFEGNRSINKAYLFYNVDKDLCLEGLEYYKITKNYFDFTKEDDINIKNGFPFQIDGVDYLVNYFNKGYINKDNYSVYQLDQRLLYLMEFCNGVITNDLLQPSNNECIAVVSLKNKVDYMIDIYPIEAYEPKNISNKFKKNEHLVNIVKNKEYSTLNAKLGIFFIDTYKDCFNLEDSRTGGFLYYALEDYNIIVSPFNTITLKEIYNTLASLLDEIELPISITTDSDFLFDIFNKSFDKNIDFILDKSDVHNRFIRELSTLLTLKSYDDFGLQSFSLIIENNYNEVSASIDNFTITEFENVLHECLDMYANPDFEDDLFDDEFQSIEEDEEIEDFEVDSKLFS